MSDHPRTLAARNFLSLSAGQILILGLGFVSSIYSRRVLGATVVGEVAWTASILSYFSLIINPGVETIAKRDVAKSPHEADNYVAKVVSLELCLGVFSFCLVGLLALLKLRGAEISLLLVLQGIGLLLVPVNIGWLLLARERMTAQVLIAGGFQLLQLPALFLLVRDPADVVWYVLLPYPFTLAAAGVILWYATRQRLLDWRRVRWTLLGGVALLREAIPIGLSQAAILIYFNSDSIFLGFLCGDRTVGLYSTAYRLWNYAIFPFSALSQAYFPAFARASADPEVRREVSAEFFRLLSWFGLPVAALCWAGGRHFVHLLYGTDYAESGLLFEWLSLNILLSSVTWGSLAPLNAWGHQKATLYITLLGAVVNVGLNFVVIPRYGAPGAVATTLLAELVVLIAGLRARRKICSLPWARLVWKPLLTAIIGAIVTRFAVRAAPAFWWGGLLVGGVLCAFLFVLLEKRLVRLLIERFRASVLSKTQQQETNGEGADRYRAAQ